MDLAELVTFYRKHPVIAAKDLLNVELATAQSIVFRDMWNNKFVIITAGRGNGKSFMLGAFAALYAMLFPGTRIGLIAPSFRQCVVGDTYVLTDNGIELVGDLVEHPSKMFSKAGFRDCTDMFRNPAEKTVKLSFTNGIELEGALDHKVLTISKSGDMEYTRMDSLDAGDCVCARYNTQCFGNSMDLTWCKEEFVSGGNLRRENLPAVLDADFSYFLGALVGDGCISHSNYIGFINTDDDILGRMESLFTQYFGSCSRTVNSDGVVNLVRGSKLGYAYLGKLGFAGVKADTKTVPSVILKASEENQVAFLRGLYDTYDTDGCVYFNTKVSHKYKIHYASISDKLIKQMQIMLLNLGIKSVLNVNTSKSRQSPLFCLEISDKESVIRFITKVGFFCSRKKAVSLRVLDYIYSTDVSRRNKDYVPNVGFKMESVVSRIRSSGGRPFEYLHLYKNFDARSAFTGNKTSITTRFLTRVLQYCGDNNIVGEDVDYLAKLCYNDFLFLEVKDKSYGFDYTYDFTVDDEHNYVSNGVISHNSKIVFEEVRKIWYAAPLLREATSGKPTFQSDRCVLNFRSVGSVPASLIEADPLGTGEKIRGLRMHIILSDEFANIPKDIFDAVVKPFAATSSSPMERVKEVALQKKLREMGADESQLGGASQANKIIMASSAYYKFNHMYSRIEEYMKFIEQGKPGFAVRSINYLDMPDGFMNEDVIEEAKATMPSSLFRMEYLGIWESDSDGVFKASLLEKCWLPPGDSVHLVGEPGKRYVISCDPARTSDNFAIIVIEIGEKYHKVVNAVQYNKIKFPKMADVLFDFCNRYDVQRLVIDSQGGGHAVKDLLADESRFGKDIIIDIDDEEYIGVEGRRILQMIKPSPVYNAQANYSTLNVLEQGKLMFSGPATSGKVDEEDACDTIRTLVYQLLNIVVTQTKSGNVHFDVPNGEGHGSQKKDLYSAFIYGVNKVYELVMDHGSNETIIWNRGIVVPVDNAYNGSQATNQYNRPSIVVPDNATLTRAVRK